jgi:hypothetical protein
MLCGSPSSGFDQMIVAPGSIRTIAGSKHVPTSMETVVAASSFRGMLRQAPPA